MSREIFCAVGVLSVMAPTSQAQITPRAEVLSGAFERGFVGEAEEKRYPIRVVRIGEMEITSGRVLLADPFLMSTYDRPLALSVTPGRYPVELAVADAGESGQRVALARLLLSPAPAVRWAMAVTDEQDATTLNGDEVFGYGVDAGTGAFVDAAVPAWLATEYPSSNYDAYATLQDDWQRRGEAAAETLGIPYGFALIERLGQGDVAMFSSGWGDGHYASWVGYDAADHPVAIVTDFAVITAVNFPPTANAR